MAGINIGALLRGDSRDQIVRGLEFLLNPGTATYHRKFTAQVYVLTKMKVDVILLSSTTTVLSSTSEQQT